MGRNWVNKGSNFIWWFKVWQRPILWGLHQSYSALSWYNDLTGSDRGSECLTHTHTQTHICAHTHTDTHTYSHSVTHTHRVSVSQINTVNGGRVGGMSETDRQSRRSRQTNEKIALGVTQTHWSDRLPERKLLHWCGPCDFWSTLISCWMGLYKNLIYCQELNELLPL